MSEGVAGIQGTKGFGREEHEFERFHQRSRPVLGQQRAVTERVSRFGPTVAFLGRVNLVILLAVGGTRPYFCVRSMLNPRLETLSDYPFRRLERLLAPIEPPPGRAPAWPARVLTRPASTRSAHWPPSSATLPASSAAARPPRPSATLPASSAAARPPRPSATWCALMQAFERLLASTVLVAHCEGRLA